MSSSRLGQAIGSPSARLQELLGEAQRVMNIDGCSILTCDLVYDVIRLELLWRQFDPPNL
jgi:hypothetical protein